MFKRLAVILALGLALTSAVAKVRSLNFENPGNRRLLKTEAGNYWYYRSLPETSMTLNVDGITSIQLRSFGIESLRNPQVVAVFGKVRKTYDLSLRERLDGYYMYNELAIPIPQGTKSMEIICYDRSIYFRAFYTVTPVPKPKVTKPANLVVKAHGGVIDISHNGTVSPYYTFNSSQSLKFTVNNGRNAQIYVRARLLDRTLPVFELYRNGDLVGTYEFSLMRSTKYKATGVNFLTVGKKLELPALAGSAEYELKAASDHLFFGRPVVLKKK
jgi:hypothetical protein